jgi:hypothetical protein
MGVCRAFADGVAFARIALVALTARPNIGPEICSSALARIPLPR